MIINVINASSGEQPTLPPLVLFCSGQSNMQGKALNSELPVALQGFISNCYTYYSNDEVTQENGFVNDIGDPNYNADQFQFLQLKKELNRPVYNATSTEHGVDLHVANLIAQNQNRKVYVLKYSRGSTAINAWDPNDAAHFMYLPMIAMFNQALTAIPEAEYEKGFFLWDQGESNAGDTAVEYRDAGLDLYSRLRIDIDADLAVIARKISTAQTSLDPADISALQDGQEQIAANSANNYIIGSNTWTFPDGLHADEASMQIYAQEIYNIYINNIAS